jgi:hypothetical protein
MKRIVTGDLCPAPANFSKSHFVLSFLVICLRLTPERADRPAGQSSAVTVAPVTERLSRLRHWLRPSSAPSGLPHGPRLGLSGCEETAERGIKEAQMATTEMTVKIQPNDKGNPPGKLADAELHFTDGPLEGLKLIGFAIWETRGGARRNVTFPARQYAVNGERRSFALLRPIVDTAAQERIRELVLEAYAAYGEHASIAS